MYFQYCAGSQGCNPVPIAAALGAPAGFPRLGAVRELDERAPLCTQELRVFAQR